MSREDFSGDGEWIRSAVRRYEGPLTLYAARLVGDLEQARDVVQETFLRLCRQRQARIQPHLAEWLYTVCRNRALDVRRKEGRTTRLSTRQAALQASPAATPAEAVEQSDTAAQVLGMLAQLSENQQEVIRLKFQAGLSYRQISGVTGLSVSNVGYLIHTGLKAIRERLTVARPAESRT